MLSYDVAGARATITINDPDRRNPLTAEAMAELAEKTRRAVDDPEVRVIVITGAGDKAFSAGGDLSGGFVDDAIGRHDERGALAEFFRVLRRGGKPAVARVNGHALAGGLGVAAACDVVIAVSDARFGVPEINVGLFPMMIAAVLQRCMPHRASLDLMLTGRLIEAEEARALGLVSQVVPRDELDATVDATVDLLTSKSPAVMRFGRDAFYGVQDLSFDVALDHAQAALTLVTMTDDAAEGVAAFRERREPRWAGR